MHAREGSCHALTPADGHLGGNRLRRDGAAGLLRAPVSVRQRAHAAACTSLLQHALTDCARCVSMPSCMRRAERPPLCLSRAHTRPLADMHSSAGCLQDDPSLPRVVLLCGSDLVASFAAPGVWRRADVRELCTAHGVVCVARPGSDAARLLSPGVRLLGAPLVLGANCAGWVLRVRTCLATACSAACCALA